MNAKINSIIGLLLSIMIVIMGAFDLNAKPARPGWMTFTQPDGSSLKIMMVGGPRSHYLISEDGYMLKQDGQWLYFASLSDGEPVCSSYQAAAPGERSQGCSQWLESLDKTAIIDAHIQRSEALTPLAMSRAGLGLYPSASFPTLGEVRTLVLLVNFSDVEFSMEDPHDYFSRMLNEEGFSDNGGTGSARDYFIDNSLGLFVPSFDVYGPVTLPNKSTYYGKNDRYGYDAKAYQIVVDGCQLLDDEIDFSLYDEDGDGYVDNVYVFYAGYGECDTYIEDLIWPHQYNISYCTSSQLILDDKIIDRYACSNEIDYYYERTDDRGTIIHEFSHVLGLPDLYTTDYSTTFTPGEWSAMDVGCYNDESRTPPAFSSFERYALGWIELELLQAGDCQLASLIDSNKAYIATATDNASEYFLFENRQPTSYDAFLPGHGMLVWHIDYNGKIWEANTVNNRSSHQYVDLIEADNKHTEATRSGDSFPGTSWVTSFTPLTTPAFEDWNSKDLGWAITDIEESADGIISFTCEEYESAIKTVGADSLQDQILTDGLTVTNRGVEPATIINTRGLQLATLKGGEAFTVSAPGVYILSLPSATLRLLLH
ncbi:MAG: M6 family metalloprotease domain-containing protein [Bacteroidales bacterium]|nr:M6 family metalloprotease domain-containing protein [Bacteroidales bacterium]